MKRNYDNKVIWITGASSGIGAELARQFEQAGARLVLSARNVKSLNELKAKLMHPTKHLVLPLDLVKPETFVGLVSTVIDEMGGIDVLVNNGGVSQRANARDTAIEVDREIMDVNYFGPMALTKAALPALKKSSGQLIVISSVAGKFGFHFRSAYSASKHALHGFFESLALEEKDSICLTMVCPGKINTSISFNALNAKGEASQIIDPNHISGMSVEKCVRIILRAARREKSEVLMGGKEVLAVYIKRYFPAFFRALMRKQKPS